MKTAGLVLDFYDDSSGETLKRVCPTPEELPESVKTAHLLSPEERNILRDEAFALILHNDGKQLRKFACVDEGNTVLSTIYFMENFYKLPEEAIKVAAAKLVEFNEEFGLEVPAQVKLAAVSGMARKRNSDMTPAVVGDEADWAARTNILSVRGGADSGRVIPTANQMKTASVEKVAVTEKWIHGKIDAALSKIKDPKKGLARVRKFSNQMQRTNDKAMAHGDGLRDIGAWNKKFEYANRAERAAGHAWGFKPKVSSVVDVSGLEADPVIMQKQASKTALAGRYSLDSYTDVQEAIKYFENSWTEMAPEARHEFSVKTAARAEELGISTPELMQRYGSSDYSPDIDAHLANRRQMAPDFSEVWNELQEKRAMIEPEVFAQLLKEADEHCGLNYEWGGAVCDPYFATFGGQHETEKLAWAYEDAEGNKLTADELKAIPSELVEKNFSPDFAQAFAHDPTTIFDSMPADTKQVIARMALNA